MHAGHHCLSGGGIKLKLAPLIWGPICELEVGCKLPSASKVAMAEVQAYSPGTAAPGLLDIGVFVGATRGATC